MIDERRKKRMEFVDEYELLIMVYGNSMIEVEIKREGCSSWEECGKSVMIWK